MELLTPIEKKENSVSVDSVSVEIPPVTTLDVSEDLSDEVCHWFFISYFARFLEQIGRIETHVYRLQHHSALYVIKLLRQISAFDTEGEKVKGMELITCNFDLVYHQTSRRAKLVALFVSSVQFIVSIYIFYNGMFLIVELKFVKSQYKIN